MTRGVLCVRDVWNYNQFRGRNVGCAAALKQFSFLSKSNKLDSINLTTFEIFFSLSLFELELYTRESVGEVTCIRNPLDLEILALWSRV